MQQKLTYKQRFNATLAEEERSTNKVEDMLKKES